MHDNDFLSQGVQVYIEIIDEDTISSNDLVDRLLIDHNQTVARPLRQNHTGMYNLVTMDLTITVFCAENFGGSDCSMQCVPGLTGPDCNETDHCSGVSCGDNGVCRNVINSFQCMCSPGFTGVLCQTNIDGCVGVDCTGNGTSVCVCVCVCVFRGLNLKVFVLQVTMT